jgi:hypothetical protein
MTSVKLIAYWSGSCLRLLRQSALDAEFHFASNGHSLRRLPRKNKMVWAEIQFLTLFF